jgi:hypothetical protein
MMVVLLGGRAGSLDEGKREECVYFPAGHEPGGTGQSGPRLALVGADPAFGRDVRGA